MANNSSNRLKAKLENLPVFDPKDSLWNEIENRLDFDLKLNVALNHLPNFEPKQELWYSISEKLDSSVDKKTKHLRPFQWLTIAASILLLISVGIYFSKTNKNKLLVETELSYNETHFDLKSENLNEGKALEMIEQLCASNQPQCNSIAFREKIGLYNELENEAIKLESVIETIGESPEIIKAMIRIENMKSQTIQELITLVNS